MFWVDTDDLPLASLDLVGEAYTISSSVCERLAAVSQGGDMEFPKFEHLGSLV
jgi:hypothetical protein